MSRKRVHRRYGRKHSREGSAPRKHNPPLMSDLLEWVGPGFAAFAATRFGTRIAATQLAKRKPSWGKHAGAAVSVGAFLAAWYLGHRLKWTAKYHTPITVGAAIAALQSLFQLYLPKFGWMVADASPEIAAPQSTQLTANDLAQMNLRPVNDDPNEYTYNDSFDAGRYGTKTGRAADTSGGPAGNQVDVSDLEIDEAIGQSANLGVFSN